MTGHGGVDPTGPISDISRLRIATLYPGLRPLTYLVLQDIFRTTTRKMNVVEGMRTFDEQLSDYAKGRKQVGDTWVIENSKQIVTNAKPGLSWHCYGLAFDGAWAGLDPYLDQVPERIRNTLWYQFGQVGKSHGFQWGGEFLLLNGVRDIPHLELTYGLTIEQALELYQHGGVRAVWAFCDRLRGVPEGQDWNLSADH